MSEKWYCPRCKDYVEQEYAVNIDECPICGSQMVYPKPEPLTVNGKVVKPNTKYCQTCTVECEGKVWLYKEKRWLCLSEETTIPTNEEIENPNNPNTRERVNFT